VTTILQISDTHIVPKGALVSGRLETAAPFRRLVQRITDIRDQIGVVDAVLISGDVSDDGSDESYQLFKEILAPLDLPFYVIPGNHDAREPMRAAFSGDGYLPETGKLNWHQKIGDIHLIGLDTLIEGEKDGMMDAPTLAYLDHTLTSIGHEPVLLALHHPPFKTGIRFMDDIGFKNSVELLRVLSGFGGELRIVCGHIHCMMTVSLGGHIAISAPSPSSNFALDTRPNAPVGFMDMEDGCLLHKWDGGFQTVRIGPESGAGPFPF
jgi:3',5'-cyclic AMP phosphodiesterase CpdA